MAGMKSDGADTVDDSNPNATANESGDQEHSGAPETMAMQLAKERERSQVLERKLADEIEKNRIRAPEFAGVSDIKLGL